MKPSLFHQQRFWEQFGYRVISDREGTSYLVDPFDFPCDLPDIDSPEFMGLLIRYCSPKLTEQGWMWRVQYHPVREDFGSNEIKGWIGYASLYYVRFDRPLNFRNNYFAIDKEPHLALYWAISKAVGLEVENDELP